MNEKRKKKITTVYRKRSENFSQWTLKIHLNDIYFIDFMLSIEIEYF